MPRSVRRLGLARRADRTQPPASSYELIQRLRPNFLRTRGAVHGVPNSQGQNSVESVDLVVYLNESRHGASDQLRQTATTDIQDCQDPVFRRRRCRTVGFFPI